MRDFNYRAGRPRWGSSGSREMAYFEFLGVLCGLSSASSAVKGCCSCPVNQETLTTEHAEERPQSTPRNSRLSLCRITPKISDRLRESAPEASVVRHFSRGWFEF